MSVLLHIWCAWFAGEDCELEGSSWFALFLIILNDGNCGIPPIVPWKLRLQVLNIQVTELNSLFRAHGYFYRAFSSYLRLWQGPGSIFSTCSSIMTSFVLFAVFKGTRLTGWLQGGCKHCRCRTLSTVQIGISTILPYSSMGVSVLWQNVRKHQKVWFLVELLAVAVHKAQLSHMFINGSMLRHAVDNNLYVWLVSVDFQHAIGWTAHSQLANRLVQLFGTSCWQVSVPTSCCTHVYHFASTCIKGRAVQFRWYVFSCHK